MLQSGTPIASHFSRRDAMTVGGGLLAVSLIALAPAACGEEIAAEIKSIYGDKAMAEAKITLDMPTIAENGLVVPLSFAVESPMSEVDYVKTVRLFAQGNPNPLVAAFHFTPLCPKAAASLRIRLAQSQKVVAIAEMSSGGLYTTAKEVKVTIGGCGG